MELPDPPPPPPDSGIEVRVVDLQTGQITDLKDGGPDFAPGHHDCGRGSIVGADNWNNRYTFRHLGSPHQFNTTVSFEKDWSLSGHVSLLADDESWALVSTFLANELPNSGVFKNELFLAATDGSGRVRRLAHHHSVYRDYADTPRANISRDGRFVAFTSNWGSSSRRDVFVVRIPPSRYETPLPHVQERAPVYSSTNTVTPRNAAARTASPVAAPLAAASPKAASLPIAESANASAAQPVKWTALLNCAVNGDSLQKNTGSNSLADAEARSVQRISNGAGYVEFTATEADKTRMIGLAHDPSELSYASLDFAIKLTTKGVAEVRENNAYAGETAYAAGDVFRISVENHEVKYYQNGKLFFTSLNKAADTLFAKAVLVHLGARASRVVIATGK
jgi:hypothetical protein